MVSLSVLTGSASSSASSMAYFLTVISNFLSLGVEPSTEQDNFIAGLIASALTEKSGSTIITNAVKRLNIFLFIPTFTSFSGCLIHFTTSQPKVQAFLMCYMYCNIFETIISIGKNAVEKTRQPRYNQCGGNIYGAVKL